MSAKRTVRGDQKAATRVQLKRAALECFAEKGYAATQVADVAKRAGVAHGTFYVHFPTKTALVDELLAEFEAGTVARLERAWARLDLRDPHASTRKLAEVCLDHWQSERELLVAFVERFADAGGLAVARDGLTPDVGAFLTTRLAALEGGARIEHPALVAQALLGLWTRVGLQVLFGDTSRKAAVDVLASLSLGALAAVAPALRPLVFPPERSPR